MVKPTVVSLFAGCGGSSLGYKLAGFDERLAVEWDDNAAEVFRINFPKVPLYHGDIAQIGNEELLELSKLKPGELDILDGSPPCQGFSTAGKRIIDDPRNSLFREYARILEILKPKVFVMENVTGMVKGYMKQTYLEIVATLRGAGYKVRGEIMDASFYGVPQRRKRVIIIGVRNDLGIDPSHPKPQTKPIPLRLAWKGIKNSREELEEAAINPGYKTAKIAARLKPGQKPKDLGIKSFFNLVRPRLDRPCPTVTKMTGGCPSSSGLMHPEEMRRPTIRELKAVASFPEDFIFTGSFGDKWARIGNSVPPNLMRAIAWHIKTEILDKERKR